MFRVGNNPQDTTGSIIVPLLPEAGFNSPRSNEDSILNQTIQIVNSKDSISNDLYISPRNRFAFVTFADSGTTLRISDNHDSALFPYLFIKASKELKAEQYTLLKDKLREGKTFPENIINGDWILIILFVSAFLFALIRTTSKNLYANIFKVLTNIGQRNNISGDIGGLFYWQSTLLNLAAFLNISLFIYLFQSHNNLLQLNFPQIFLWGLLFLSVITSVTLRHIVCTITGNLSGETDGFREYLYGIYQLYRFLGMILFVLNILILYTSFISPEICFTAGFIAISILYLLRIIRLLIIFIIRHISKFYFILYLCALEILPVVIIIKFLTGVN